MTQISLYIATSLDGYIARPDGGIDWLDRVDRPGEDYGYARFLASVDGLLMGRKTYDLCLSFGAWPYPGSMSYVFTRGAPVKTRDDVVFVQGAVDRALTDIAARGHRHLWLVGGGALVGAFRAQDLIDDYIISTIPTILGSGIPLFPPGGPERSLELVGARHYPSGLVQAHYRRAGN